MIMNNIFKQFFGDDFELPIAEPREQSGDDKSHKSVLTAEQISEMIANLKKDKRGKYIFDSSKPYGSVENPVVVGMPECSDVLIYDAQKNRWILTDGLGNGWIR